MKFTVYSYYENGTHGLYGEFHSTIAEILENPNKTYELRNGNTVGGTLTFDVFQVVEKPSFVEYLRSGWFINMACAIDFTASNGEVYESNSLHK